MKAGIFGIIVPALMKKPTEEYMEKMGIPFSKKEVKKEFNAIISRQPEIGGIKNNLIMGLYLAAYFMAVYKVNPKKITAPVYEGLVSAIGNSAIFHKMCEKRNFFTRKNMETRQRLSTDKKFNSYEDNWKYTFAYNKEVPECTILYNRCAICEMARRENCFKLMKYLCVTDFIQQELMGNTLIRTKTLGNGDDCCDFHIIGKKKEDKSAI